MTIEDKIAAVELQLQNIDQYLDGSKGKAREDIEREKNAYW